MHPDNAAFYGIIDAQDEEILAYEKALRKIEDLGEKMAGSAVYIARVALQNARRATDGTKKV